MEEKEKAIQ
jgi:hypothetical protein